MKVTCGLIISGNTVLTVQRGEKSYHARKWEFPGGKVNKNESYEDCLIRELHEELNIGVQIHSQLPIILHQYPDFEIELIPFVCEITKGEVILNEHIAMEWCSVDALQKLDFSEADQIIIERMKKAGRVPALGNSDKK